MHYLLTTYDHATDEVTNERAVDNNDRPLGLEQARTLVARRVATDLDADPQLVARPDPIVFLYRAHERQITLTREGRPIRTLRVNESTTRHCVTCRCNQRTSFGP